MSEVYQKSGLLGFIFALAVQIASTSGGNQYHDTGLTPTKNFLIVIDFAYNAATGGGSAFDLGPEVVYETVVKWAALGGGNYANPASWEGGAVPDAGDTAFFQDTSSYTVSFPAGGLDAPASLLLSKSTGTTTFDASGTWWQMPASDDGEDGTTYEQKPIQYRVGTKFPLTLSRAVNGGGCYSSPTASSPSRTGTSSPPPSAAVS